MTLLRVLAVCMVVWGCSDRAGDKGTQMLDAIRAQDFRTAEALLRDGARVDARDAASGASALILACMEGRRELAAALVARGAKINVTDKTGRTAPQYACLTGRPDLVELLLAHGAKVNTRSREGDGPLHNAAARGDVVVAAMLLEKGAKVNAKGPAGLSPLMLAVFGSPEMVDLLLEHGARIDQRDENGNTALICAAGPFKAQWRSGDNASNTLETSGGNARIANRLLEAGAGVNLKNTAGYTAWSLAASAGYPEIARLLKTYGAVETGTRMDVNEAFRRALFSERFDRAAALLGKGAAVDHTNESGSTALMQAAYTGNAAVAGMLLENGADVTIRNQYGYTALEYAVEKGHEAVKELLSAHGAIE